MTYPEAAFEAWLSKYPAGAQANVRDSASRKASMTVDAFFAGYAASLDTIEAQAAEIERLRVDADAKQAEIDRLMLEFCPDEMTVAQKALWSSKQRPCSPELKKMIDAAIAKEKTS